MAQSGQREEALKPSEKYARQIGSWAPKVWGENKKFLSCHHLDLYVLIIFGDQLEKPMDFLEKGLFPCCISRRILKTMDTIIQYWLGH